MEKTKIVIRPESSLEAIIALAPTVQALKKKHQNSSLHLLVDPCFHEALPLVPELDGATSDHSPNDIFYDLSNEMGESWGSENIGWKAYLQGCSNSSEANSFHLIDVFKRATNLEDFEENFELKGVELKEDALPETITGGTSLRISLCLNSLSSEQIQSVLQGISQLEISATVHLIGTVSERKKSALLLSAWGQRIDIVDLCGRQSLAQIAATFQLCDLTICGPGKSALLSSGYGTFSICIDKSINPLHYPYGHGHLIIQEAGSELFSSALSTLIKEIVSFAVTANGGNIPSADQWQNFADDRIDDYLSHLRLFITQRVETKNKNHSSFTKMQLKPLLFLGSGAADILQAFYEVVWEASLSNRQIGHNIQIIEQNALAEISNLLKPLERFYELAAFGGNYSKLTKQNLEKGDLAAAKVDSARIQEVEDLIYGLGRAFPNLAPICAFHEKRQHLISSNNAVDIAIEMQALFLDMQNRILIILDLAKTLFQESLLHQATLSEKGFLREEQIDG